ncbi:MAG: NAD(P)-dependent oxidoreductase [Anaerolineales bacterium]|nr:NAD(P)-dependent oxidoreductase [Anaerolineales bacterium]MCS7248465.1 NAD(P)-dependent oxidoreductase [Anaerolineales bacterium]MDW8162278.1 NAD(P)-dependent oxidoreductase [Anaerolineales bacterium]MDW8447330.1 NAD(P)-dependent oxidoreductase [Anaerolineales bacterium]
MKEARHVLITGGAGYIGSALCSELLRQGYQVTVIDELLYGGESLLGYLLHPNLHFAKANILEPRAVKDNLRRDWPKPSVVVHLAALAGFPACQAVGRQVAWRYNVEATQRVYEQAEELSVERFIYASTYSNYGLSPDGKPVTEESPLNPQSLYAETKIASERFLLNSKGNCAVLILRLATLYGLSPRMRFDLIVNQFVLEAYTKRELLIYQRGYSRSFVHIKDAICGILLGIESPLELVRGEIYNLGSDRGNYTKDQVVALILKRLPETRVSYKDMTFGGDMRDLSVSFEKIQRQLGFQAQYTLDDGVREVLQALQIGIFHNPLDSRYRNAQFIVQ